MSKSVWRTFILWWCAYSGVLLLQFWLAVLFSFNHSWVFQITWSVPQRSSQFHIFVTLIFDLGFMRGQLFTNSHAIGVQTQSLTFTLVILFQFVLTNLQLCQKFSANSKCKPEWKIFDLYVMLYLAWSSLSERSCMESLIAATSAISPSIGTSAQRSMWGRILRFSNLVSANFNGLILAFNAHSSSRMTLSCSSISSWVWKNLSWTKPFNFLVDDFYTFRIWYSNSSLARRIS